MKKVAKKLIAMCLLIAVSVSGISYRSMAQDFEQGTQTVSEQETKPTMEHKVNYVLVEKPYISAPETQNILVSWGDGTENVQKMQIIVEDENGNSEIWDYTEQNEEVYLFAKEYTDTNEQHVYCAKKLLVTEDEEQTVDLSSIGVVAQFGVNRYYDGIEELELLTEEEAVAAPIQMFTLQHENGQLQMDKPEGGEQLQKQRGEIVIALDPGHDRTHGGTSGVTSSGQRLYEQDLTLKIAKYTKEELEKYDGVRVYMTRTTDACPYPGIGGTGKCIEKRVEASAYNGAAAFISFHLNSGPSTAKGAEVIVPNRNWKPQLAEQGRGLAEEIMRQLSALGISKRPVPIYSKDTTLSPGQEDYAYADGSKADYFTAHITAKEQGIPAIIVEHAFMTNKTDMTFLDSEYDLKQIGLADATGIAEYFHLQKGGSNNIVQGKPGWNLINGEWYYFDANGVMQLGWQYIKGAWYYLNEAAGGAMATGWLQLGNFKYYLKSDGEMVTGWQEIAGKWNYFRDSGYAVRSCWDIIDGKWYLFDENGVMVTGWRYVNGYWYYMDASGVVQTGWITLGSKKYYANASGAMLLGWEYIDGSWYYLDGAAGGAMATGWLQLGNFKYYLKSDGKMATGWQEIAGKWYYFRDSGYAVRNCWDIIDGKWYHFDADGARRTGWQSINGAWYYMDANGVMQTGWLQLGQKKYYLDETGRSVTGYKVINGMPCRFDSQGALIVNTGWQSYNGNWYYNGPNGFVCSDWYPVNWRWYYFDANGVMQTGWMVIDNQKYYLDPYGAMVIGWRGIGNYWYYFDHKGVMQTGWIFVDGKQYYLDANGAMQTGFQTIGTKDYYFHASGEMHTGLLKLNNNIYYFNENGEMQKGCWICYQGKKYYFDAKGIAVKGWYYLDQKWYYFDADGGLVQDQMFPRDLHMISGNSYVSKEKMARYYRVMNSNYPATEMGKGGAPTIEAFCTIVMEEAQAEGIRADVVFAQAMLETGWLRFGGDVKIDQFNFAGLGATGNGVAGERFKDVRTGIRAQVQHLKAYANAEALHNACVDNRFKYVARNSAPFVEWLGQKENPVGLGWATGKDYGTKILAVINKIINY